MGVVPNETGFFMLDMAICSVEFSENFGLMMIPELGAYTLKDLLNGVKHYHPKFQQRLLNLSIDHKFVITINDTFRTDIRIDDLDLLLHETVTKVKIQAIPVGQGNVGKVLVGVGVLALGISGVGLLGLTATTTGLLGASLVFNSVFKHPKTNNSDQEADKKSFNYNGVINSVGGGTPLPLIFGRVITGSIVVSEQVIPTDAPV